MLIERQKRLSRVRFKHPIRVVTLEGQPRVIRTLTANVSRKGLFLRMPEPLPLGTKVALSLEAGGRALALAQAEVVWGRVHESQLPGRFPGCGVRFTEFMHPRAQELVDYLVHNLDRGKPLLLAPPERAWMRWLPAAGGAALLACAALATLLLWPAPTPSAVEEEPEGPTLEMVAAPPLVRSVQSAPGRVNEVAELRSVPPAVSEAALKRSDPELAPDSAIAKNSEEEGPPSVAEGPVAMKARAEVSPVPTQPDSAIEKKTEAEASPSSNATAAISKTATNAVRTEPDSVVARKTERDAPPNAPVVRAQPDSPAAKRATVDVAQNSESPLARQAVTAVRSAAVDKKGPAAPASREVVVAPKSKVASAKSEGGKLKLPSGAAASLSWALKGSELRLSPELLGQAQVTRAFVLAGPPRAVFDIIGSTPSRSHTVPASPPYSTAVRLGKLPSGTRLVIDLDAAPKRSSQDGSSLVLSF